MLGSSILTVKVKPEEKEFIEKLAHYLYKTNRIREDTISEVVRYAIFNVLGPLVLKEIEERRFQLQT